ncbi:uncharacterized protein LOC143622701 [Bidens hawaiensis]|uniref:uncharacterized protein LOC143622701 n=1 Tax=Bidens hawaiensis TaxID=980011 RepID=UPI0040495796
MPVVRHCSGTRVDTFELKVQMERRLGSQKSQSYFNLLTRYLSLKIGKSEFDKVCVCLIGRENIRLHNELIRAILTNATVCNTPPPKQVKHDSLLTFKDANGGGLQSICRDAFPQSPKKGRTPIIRERKFKDRPGPGLNEKSRERVPITAPFGIDTHSNKKRKVSCDDTDSSYYSGQLQSTSVLENRLKQKSKMEGLDVTTDCVNLLNNGLNSYLKRVIKPTLELARSRCIREPGKKLTASLLDFRMATMVDPKILGEDWPVQLEKISLSAFEQSAGLENK